MNEKSSFFYNNQSAFCIRFDQRNPLTLERPFHDNMWEHSSMHTSIHELLMPGYGTWPVFDYLKIYYFLVVQDNGHFIIYRAYLRRFLLLVF